MRAIVIAAFGLAAIAAPVRAQQPLTLQFNDGLVSLNANNVPVRTILGEWARLGGTRVVGADRITGAPLTIQLDNVPEAQALDIILRNVAGYMAAPRQAQATGASSYDRILVLATATTPAVSAPATAARGANGNAQRAIRGQQPAFEVQQPVSDDVDVVNEPAPFSFPDQNPFQPVGQPGPFGTPIVAPGAPPQMLQFGQGTSVTVNPTPDQPMPVLQFPGMPVSPDVPGGGFGVVGAPMPGVVVQPAQPGVRPPGGD